MARVVVIGGGFAGTASAARLAKLGHETTLLEARDRLGGALDAVAHEGFSWDLGPTTTLLPAVVRDLFRKSGRPLERELDLVPRPIVAVHRFPDGSSVALPGATRAGQMRAFDELAPGLGQEWVDHVASFSDAWDLLRKEWFERAWDPVASPDEVTRLVNSRESLRDRVRRTLRDPRARLVAEHPVRGRGDDPRRTPAWAALDHHLAERFGVWSVPGGMAALADAMTQRLQTRKVTVRTHTRALDLVVRAGTVVAVRTDQGDVAADAVVVAIDPRLIPALAPHVRSTAAAALPDLTCLAVEGELAQIDAHAGEIVLHGRRNTTLTLRPAYAPSGATAFSVLTRGQGADVLDALAAHGLDLAGRVIHRHDLPAVTLAERWSGSPYGVQWAGRRTTWRRLGPRTPITGVYAAGAHTSAGSGLPFAGLGAALVAAALGPA